jgi:hypothetical protein
MASGAIGIIVCTIIYLVIGGALLYVVFDKNPKDKG